MKKNVKLSTQQQKEYQTKLKKKQFIQGVQKQVNNTIITLLRDYVENMYGGTYLEEN